MASVSPSQRNPRLLIVSVLAAILVGGIYWVAYELRTSQLQARLFTKFARELEFKVGAGPTHDIRFPTHGPYDKRLGYQQLPAMIDGLTGEGFEVTAQARMSPRLLALTERGISPPYREKDQAGLEILDCRARPLFRARVPERVYERFEDVPSLLVDALLFVENRGLLDPERAMLNPAVDGGRLLKAVFDRALRVVDRGHASPGASTLATQIEKFRHSPEGRTESVSEKLRQMTSASLRAYIDGKDTMPRRQEIIRSYLNTVPLAAQAGFGEVNGLGDGLWAWYGRDFAEVNRLLMTYRDGDIFPAPLRERRRALAFKQALFFKQAEAYKQALSLMIAQRRPSDYLANGAPSLGALTDSYLRVMAAAGVISPVLRDAALQAPLRLRVGPVAGPANSFVDHKAATAVRATLSRILDTPLAYDLDRIDLVARSSIDGEAQQTASRMLRSLRDPAAARAAGLYGFHLLSSGDDPSKLSFSFTLLERGDTANLLRVQTDSSEQPFDINEGARLDLGSTAKLRTLITYLEVVSEFHARWSTLESGALAMHKADNDNPLGRWALDYLSRASDRSLAAMLDAAMNRRYSASPAEAFFTGGGLHRFANFEPKDNGRVLTVREALARSVNLVFIRLMRDLVRHYMFGISHSASSILRDQADPRRRDLLVRFADKEGRQFLARFHAKYMGKSPREAQELLLRGRRATPARLASILFALEPEAGTDALKTFLSQRSTGAGLSERSIRALFDKYGPGRLPLADRSYIAGVHPLELWLVGFLRAHPRATLGDVVAASQSIRQEAYGWLFKSSKKRAQDVRIRSMLEFDAFGEIQRAWKRLGYPFDALTPSYAAAIGASGDRPAALAELIGIIVSRGRRLPVAKLESLEFAADTPFETRLRYRPAQAERVLPEEVAATVRRALVDVVQDGTARRLRGVLGRPDGSRFDVGGKTGTGDHRIEVYGAGGRLVASRIVDRSATFVFLIGEKYFGTVMVYAHEPFAAKYRFTSALPVQLLKSLLPVILPMLEQGACSRAGN
ncbi:MAG TPA: transglycosylase domain-containing protein [Ramlibacter sp.]|jgi:membrane peptidoglycan carboxypeptidase